ncbi:hypothetical protein [Nostoc sp. MG11]|uniref:hypothetical protein n=1 Tax=Nostoc sp. MG11 TaxID=2721166 RepID=UPI001868F05D|nr:hypothetical protein [Nostoc sp. MG11]
MAKILVFDFHFSDVEIFLHELASAQAENIWGGSFFAEIMSIHDGINRKESQYFGVGGNHDNNYGSIDNSDQVFIKA